METDKMLRCIYKLTAADGLRYDDLSDITNFAERAGPDFDTTVLHEKSLERIRTIFHKYFD